MTRRKFSREDAARAMIAEMPELLDVWLAGVTTFDGQDGRDAVTKALVELTASAGRRSPDRALAAVDERQRPRSQLSPPPP
jgi:hypothetical protein